MSYKENCTDCDKDCWCSFSREVLLNHPTEAFYHHILFSTSYFEVLLNRIYLLPIPCPGKQHLPSPSTQTKSKMVKRPRNWYVHQKRFSVVTLFNIKSHHTCGNLTWWQLFSCIKKSGVSIANWNASMQSHNKLNRLEGWVLNRS